MSAIAHVRQLPNGAALVQLPNELDIATKDSARRLLADAAAASPHLVVDMRDVDFMDCAGLSTLMWARNAVLGAGGSIVLLAPRRQAARLLAVARLQSALPVIHDLRDAVLVTPQVQHNRLPAAPATANGRGGVG